MWKVRGMGQSAIGNVARSARQASAFQVEIGLQCQALPLTKSVSVAELKASLFFGLLPRLP